MKTVKVSSLKQSIENSTSSTQWSKKCRFVRAWNVATWSVRSIRFLLNKGVGEESQFISNSTLKSEISKNKGHEKHILKSYNCFRMLYFYSELQWSQYYQKRKEHNEHCYQLKPSEIKIDSILGSEFLHNEYLKKLETSKVKKEKKVKFSC